MSIWKPTVQLQQAVKMLLDIQAFSTLSVFMLSILPLNSEQAPDQWKEREEKDIILKK